MKVDMILNKEAKPHIHTHTHTQHTRKNAHVYIYIYIYRNELMKTEWTLTKAIFRTFWLFMKSQPMIHSTSNSRTSSHVFMIKTNVELWKHPPLHITKQYHTDHDFIKYHLT